MLVVAVALGLLAGAEAFVSGRAAPRRGVAVRSQSVDERAMWTADYLVRAHEARLHAIASARAQATAEAEAKIAELEAELEALLLGQPVPAMAAPLFAAAAPAAAVSTAGPAHRAYTARLQKRFLARWGPSELGRLEQAPSAAPTAAAPAAASARLQTYTQRVSNPALSSRWGNEEIKRVQNA
ncbi:hypothetical protein M885DRAFT_588880 [Pelagophyceae sp. CCMP2097]|nr:hypothetical protein M885DRAFT_588880 [Pelagophyceae sp. CCMP2097]|mmetsp:Transcript_1573/g.5758  ORF Transcript_1573/g.5758 Transcript_1573/m.5758 type:complete len:183 (+) Transcript_1573:16-564(+)